MAYVIELDSTACIGCVACTRCDIFEMGEDMKAHAIDTETDDLSCVEAVAEDCPVGAIFIQNFPNEEGEV
jgi:ferredoxin